jgi:exosome complex RNA-binding protein Csl4
MEESFLPGDIVKAKVISYGDSRKIYLSTAEN